MGMIRISSLTRSAALLLAFLTLCAVAAGDNSSSNGSQAAKQFIDSQIVPRLRAYDESLSVSLATCPEMLDFSGSKTPYCTITINNVTVQVSVVYDASTKQIRIPPSSFYEFDQVERLEKANLLNNYGVKADVQCGNPRYRLLPVGTVFTCSVIGAPAVTELQLRAENNGQLFTFNPKGLSSPAWMLNAIAQHDAGKQTIIEGSTLAAWIEFVMTTGAASNKEPAVQVHCPSSVDVTGTNHAICLVSVQGHDLRREVFIDPVKGVDSRTLDVPVDLAVVQRETQEELNRRLQKSGLQPDGTVRCNTGLMVVTPPSTFYCDAFGGGAAYKVEVKVLDTTGTVQWHFISGDTAPSSAPTSSPG
jgi:hypothetical protein